MTWNYRLMKHVNGNDVFYQIHEVYYDENGNPTGWTEKASAPYGETIEELQKDLELFADALKKPAIDYTD